MNAPSGGDAMNAPSGDDAMNALSPGFAEPVLEAQACFRAVLDAMSRPGRVVQAGAGLAPPAPLMPASAALLLSLADADTPVWLDAGEDAQAWLRFHTGAPRAATPAAGTFVVATGTPPALGTLATGTEEEPERGATLLIQVANLIEGEGWHLRGPGIAQEHRLRAVGLPEGFATAWAANRALFPRGVDVVLCAGERFAALPRTVLIAEG